MCVFFVLMFAFWALVLCSICVAFGISWFVYLFGLREGHVARFSGLRSTGFRFDRLGSNTSFLQQVELDNQQMLAKEM